MIRVSASKEKKESEQKVTSEYEYEMLDVLGEMLDKFPFVPGQEAYVRWNTAYMELHSKVYVSEDACCVEPCCDGDMCFKREFKGTCFCCRDIEKARAEKNFCDTLIIVKFLHGKFPKFRGLGNMLKRSSFLRGPFPFSPFCARVFIRSQYNFLLGEN